MLLKIILFSVEKTNISIGVFSLKSFQCLFCGGGFGARPCGTLRLLLALYWGMTSGDSWETICTARDQRGCGCLQTDTLLLYCLFDQDESVRFLKNSRKAIIVGRIVCWSYFMLFPTCALSTHSYTQRKYLPVFFNV